MCTGRCLTSSGLPVILYYTKHTAGTIDSVLGRIFCLQSPLDMNRLSWKSVGWFAAAFFIATGFTAVTHAGTFPGANGLITYDLSGDVWVINPNGTGALNIAEGFEPAFSPDGNWIVFVSTRNAGWELYVIRPNGTDEKQVTNNAVVDEYFPSWVDNDTIIFKARDDTHTDPSDKQFVTVDVGETPTSVYTPFRGPDEPGGNSLAFPEVSTFGTLIFTENYFLTANTLKTGIFTSNGGGPRDMVSTFGETATNNGWSPTGQKVVYIEAVPLTFDVDIFVNNPSGGAPVNVTETPSRREATPRFSPDGKKIVFGDGDDLYIIDANGENEVPLVSGGFSNARNPDWGIVPGTEYTPVDPIVVLRTALSNKIRKLTRQFKKAKRAKNKNKAKRTKAKIVRLRRQLRSL